MGDRRQVVVKQGAEQVFLYTHWAGSELPAIVQSAMNRGKKRWADAPYLTRIIFSEMIQGSVLEETGAGIWASNMDSNHQDIHVDIAEQTVTIGSKSMSFASFASATILPD